MLFLERPLLGAFPRSFRPMLLREDGYDQLGLPYKSSGNYQLTVLVCFFLEDVPEIAQPELNLVGNLHGTLACWDV